MADIRYYDVILKPIVTEKSMNAMGEKKYTFLVHPEANKSQIKEAVEKMFEGTKVKSVNTMNMDGKNKRRGMVVGKTAKSKKAIVALTKRKHHEHGRKEQTPWNGSWKNCKEQEGNRCSDRGQQRHRDLRGTLISSCSKYAHISAIRNERRTK